MNLDKRVKCINPYMLILNNVEVNIEEYVEKNGHLPTKDVEGHHNRYGTDGETILSSHTYVEAIEVYEEDSTTLKETLQLCYF